MHSRFERQERTIRLREREKLKHDQYKLKERLEQLRHLDPAAFMTLPATAFTAPPNAPNVSAEALEAGTSELPGIHVNGAAVHNEGMRRKEIMLDMGDHLEARYKLLLPSEKRAAKPPAANVNASASREQELPEASTSSARSGRKRRKSAEPQEKGDVDMDAPRPPRPAARPRKTADPVTPQQDVDMDIDRTSHVEQQVEPAENAVSPTIQDVDMATDLIPQIEVEQAENAPLPAKMKLTIKVPQPGKRSSSRNTPTSLPPAKKRKLSERATTPSISAVRVIRPQGHVNVPTSSPAPPIPSSPTPLPAPALLGSPPPAPPILLSRKLSPTSPKHQTKKSPVTPNAKTTKGKAKATAPAPVPALPPAFEHPLLSSPTSPGVPSIAVLEGPSGDGPEHDPVSSPPGTSPLEEDEVDGLIDDTPTSTTLSQAKDKGKKTQKISTILPTFGDSLSTRRIIISHAHSTAQSKKECLLRVAAGRQKTARRNNRTGTTLPFGVPAPPAVTLESDYEMREDWIKEFRPHFSQDSSTIPDSPAVPTSATVLADDSSLPPVQNALVIST